MKVAITGATGFVGKHLVSLLRAGNIDFTVFDRSKHNLYRKETLKNFLLGKDIVVHLAAVNRDEDFTNITRVNVLGTKGLLDGMLAFAPSAKLIFASSFQAYLKNNIYGASKKIAEEVISDYRLQYGIKSIILRITNMYGPSCKPFYNSALATFAHQIKRGEPIVVNGNGTQRRDYLHVQDGVTAIRQALQYEPDGATLAVDICTGRLVSLKQIIEILKSITGKKISIFYNNSIPADDWNFSKDYKKAKKLFNWKPTINIEDGLSTIL